MKRASVFAAMGVLRCLALVPAVSSQAAASGASGASGAGYGLDLWTSLDAAVAPGGSTGTQDGAAWFEISTARGRVADQGYVAAKGASLLYPAVYAPSSGSPTMVYTITSGTINPSAAFSVLGSPGIKVVGAGAGPHWSFADAPPFNTFRWGDYSWAGPDPETEDIWMATEYIPPAAEWDGYDNWGTYVFAVSRH